MHLSRSSLRLRLPLSCRLLPLFAAAAFLAMQSGAAQAQETSSSDYKNLYVRKQEVQLYGDAQPYLSDAPENLEKRFPELKGLKASVDQEQLSGLLDKIGAAVDTLIQKVPDLTSEEQVSLARPAVAWPGGTPGGSLPSQTYHYILVPNKSPEGLILEEYRTNQNDVPLQPDLNGPYFLGFAGSWLLFSRGNRSSAQFHYLGEQKVDHRNAFVIAFAQIPGKVVVPGVWKTNDGTIIPMLIQGIAWVDQQDFRILELRTDILRPLVEYGLEQQTSRIVFSPADISQLNLHLWLPSAVDVTVRANGLFFREQHKYSKYRMYHATARLVPVP